MSPLKLLFSGNPQIFNGGRKCRNRVFMGVMVARATTVVEGVQLTGEPVIAPAEQIGLQCPKI